MWAAWQADKGRTASCRRSPAAPMMMVVICGSISEGRLMVARERAIDIQGAQRAPLMLRPSHRNGLTEPRATHMFDGPADSLCAGRRPASPALSSDQFCCENRQGSLSSKDHSARSSGTPCFPQIHDHPRLGRCRRHRWRAPLAGFARVAAIQPGGRQGAGRHLVLTNHEQGCGGRAQGRAHPRRHLFR